MVTDTANVIVRERHVHGEHEQAPKEPVSVRESLCEAKGFQLVNGLATPLDECANTVILEVLFEFVAAFGFDFVVLVDVEVVGVRVGGRGKHDLRDVFETPGI